MRVFLSYRRTDVGGHAGRLADGLGQRLGARNVFQDVATVRPGQDFAAAVDEALDASDAVLAVIGPGWLTAVGASGGRRLDEPRDYVRLELTRALRRGVRVVPVLVAGAALPAAEDLPDELRALVLRQATVLHDETWHQDVAGLLRVLQGEPAIPRSRGRLRSSVAAVAAVAAVAVAFAAAAAWRTWADDAEGEDAPHPPACPATTGPGWTPLALPSAASQRMDVDDGGLLFTVESGSWRPLGPGSWQVVLQAEMRNEHSTPWNHASYRYTSLSASGRAADVDCFGPEPEVEVQPQDTGDGTVGFRVACEPTGHLRLRLHADDDHEAILDVTPPTTGAEC